MTGEFVDESEPPGGPYVVNQVFIVAAGWGYAARCGCGWKTAGDAPEVVDAAGRRHLRSEHDLAARIWNWLPARADSRRVTLPHTVAAVLGLPLVEVTAVMAAMERDGHVVRDRAIGRQSGWHRGKPLPDSAASTKDEPAEAANLTIFDCFDDECDTDEEDGL